MNKYTSANLTVLPLVALLKKHADCVLKQDQTKQTVNEQESREKEILETADLTSDEELQKVTGIRVKKEVAIVQVAKLARQGGEILDEINDECHAVIEGLRDRLQEKASLSISAIAGNLAGFFIGHEHLAVQEAKAIFKITNFGNKFAILDRELAGENLMNKQAFFKAHAVLGFAKTIALLEPLLCHPGPLWERKTAEKCEDEELERLLTDLGREEAIQRLEDTSIGKITRKTAEEAIQRRIAHLESEQKRRGLAKR